MKTIAKTAACVPQLAPVVLVRPLHRSQRPRGRKVRPADWRGERSALHYEGIPSSRSWIRPERKEQTCTTNLRPGRSSLTPHGPGVGGEKHYPTLSIQKIMDLPVSELSAERSHLYMWVPNTALIATAIRAAEGYGYVLRNIITWIKNKPGRPTRYMQSNTELLLFCTRLGADAPVRVRGQQTVIFAPVQAHSQKPDEQYAIIERLSYPPFVELFARERPHHLSPSWSVWGDSLPDADFSLKDLGYPIPADFIEEATS
jgi:N6-adenosine-specific RNA methylase IME4